VRLRTDLHLRAGLDFVFRDLIFSLEIVSDFDIRISNLASDPSRSNKQLAKTHGRRRRKFQNPGAEDG
jgi:hypothetical protein